MSAGFGVMLSFLLRLSFFLGQSCQEFINIMLILFKNQTCGSFNPLYCTSSPISLILLNLYSFFL